MATSIKLAVAFCAILCVLVAMLPQSLGKSMAKPHHESDKPSPIKPTSLQTKPVTEVEQESKVPTGSNGIDFTVVFRKSSSAASGRGPSDDSIKEKMTEAVKHWQQKKGSSAVVSISH